MEDQLYRCSMYNICENAEGCEHAIAHDPEKVQGYGCTEEECETGSVHGICIVINKTIGDWDA